MLSDVTPGHDDCGLRLLLFLSEKRDFFQTVAFCNLPVESSGCIAMREESGLSSQCEGGLDTSGLFNKIFQLVSQRHLCKSKGIGGILNADNLSYLLSTPDLTGDLCVIEHTKTHYNDDTSPEKGLLRATRSTATVGVCVEHCFYYDYGC